MPSISKRLRRTKTATIYGASDQKITRFFIINRAWIANERLVGLTALIVIGLGVIGYATFAATLSNPAGNIDLPSAGADIYNQTAYPISGWALAPSGINHVEVYIDGVDQGTASYGSGGTRPDVCGPSMYPNNVDCVNRQQHVGWQFNISSYNYSIGGHTVQASFYGNSGGHTDSSPVSFYTDYPHLPPTANIDTPGAGASVGDQIAGSSRVINVGGWAIDNADRPETGISSLVMSVDGSTNLYYPVYGATRSDVCAVYSNNGPRPGCDGVTNGVGFNYSFDTSTVPNGTRTLHLTAYDNDNPKHSVTVDRTITINNQVGGTSSGPGTQPGGGGGGTATPPPIGLPTGNGVNPDGYVDDPKPSSQSPPNPYSGIMTLDGWAIDAQTVISKVNVYIDGTYIGASASYGNTGHTRPDVCANHAGWINCATAQTTGNVGWQITYNTAQLTNGTHKVFARIYDGEYPQHSFDTPTINFTTKNTTPPPPNGTGLPPVKPPAGTTNLPPDLLIENFDASGGIVQADGWALDNITKAESAISKVTVSVDGSFVTNAHYGDSRQAICNQYPGRPGCDAAHNYGVGWDFLIDVTRLASTTHSLGVTAYDGTGQTKTATVQFVTSAGGNCGPGAQTCAGGGSARSTADRNPTSSNKAHILYVVPNGGSDRGLDKSGSIARTITGVQSWLSGQSGGRTLSLDTYKGQTDVTYVPLPHNMAYYKNPPRNGSTYAYLIQDITNAIGVKPPGYALNELKANTKYLAFYEGTNDQSACGYAPEGGTLSYISLKQIQPAFTDSNGKKIAALSCDDTGLNGASGKGSQETQKLVAHEIFHTLGAVVGGKNCANFISNHVTDPTDLMYYGGLDPNAVLDKGRDSYWGANVKSGCNNVQQSKFIN